MHAYHLHMLVISTHRKWYIYGISNANLIQISGISRKDLKQIEALSEANLRHIKGIPQVYLSCISGISQALHHFVLLNTYLLLIQFGEESIYVDPRSDCACPG